MYKRLKAACYSGNITMSIIGNLPPLLFLTFRSQYGLSYSLLGFLVTLNFLTQLQISVCHHFQQVGDQPAVKAAGIGTARGDPTAIDQHHIAILQRHRADRHPGSLGTGEAFRKQLPCPRLR